VVSFGTTRRVPHKFHCTNLNSVQLTGGSAKPRFWTVVIMWMTLIG